VVQYVLGDHLGSTSVVLNGDGTVHSEARYYPYGVTRWRSGTLPTDYRFTGEREDGYINLVQVGSRWYDPELGRWLSPDVIVPGTSISSGGDVDMLDYDEQVRLTPLTVAFHETEFLSLLAEENREIAIAGFWFQRSDQEKGRSKHQRGPLNPQSLNRYAYCLGNPLKFVDPTGHKEEGECGFADEACASDPIYELYIALGIEDVMDFSTFATYVWIAAESYKSFQESGVFDEWVPAGIRFEGTGAILVGLDLNADVVWNWNDFEGDLFVTVGWQVGLNAGISANVGPLFTEGVYSLDDYTQINDHAGGTISDDAVLNVTGLEADYGWSDPQPDHRRIQSFYLGLLGGGEEIGLWRGGSFKTWSVTDVLLRLLPR
jgi:RHS repeat-associated protein